MLGRGEVKLLSTLEHDRMGIFTVGDAQRILASSSVQSDRNTLSNLAKKGRIKRIKKGTYLLVPFRQKDWAEYDLSLVPLLVKDYYVSFWSALRFWGMTEQLPQQVYVAVRVPKRARRFEEALYRFVVLTGRYFFGFEEVEIGGRKVRMASKEKTILDCLLHPKYCGGLGEVAKAIRDNAEELDWEKVRFFVEKAGSGSVERRLRYCLDFFGLRWQLRLFGKKEFKGFLFLDPQGERKGKCNREFGLVINADLEAELA